MLKAETLQQLAEEALDYAKTLGASQCAVQLGCDQGLQVRTRLSRPDQLEFHQGQSASVSVYRSKAHASSCTNQLTKAALREAIDSAFSAAGLSALDDCAGLADEQDLAQQFRNLHLYHPYQLDPDEAIDMVRNCEQAGLDSDSRLVNSEGAELHSSLSIDCLALSSGFNQCEQASGYTLSCALIGQGKEQQQAGHWYDTNLDFARLAGPQSIGAKAAKATLARLDARNVSPGQFPVLFDPPMARSFWRMLLAGISGGALYRKTSLLQNTLNQQLFPNWLSLTEQPHLVGQSGSSNYDGEGVATRDKQIVHKGVLRTYLLNSYSARKLGMRTTGNAGGTCNIALSGRTSSFDALCQQMGRGLVVRETMGHGLNLVTGDFSVGASGHWVENGQIAYPVQTLTISGNLLDMFRSIVALGDDLDRRSSLVTGSVLLEQMTLGGEA